MTNVARSKRNIKFDRRNLAAGQVGQAFVLLRLSAGNEYATVLPTATHFRKPLEARSRIWMMLARLTA